MECTLAAEPKPQFDLRLNKKPVDSRRVRMIIDEELSLYRIRIITREITVEESGTYELIATNERGVAKTHCKINVRPEQVKGPRFIEKFSDQNVVDGEQFELSVRIESQGRTTVSWYRNDKKLKETRSLKMIHDERSNRYTLQVDKASREKDNTKFRVKIEDQLGFIEHSADITVINQRAYFLEKMVEVEAKERDEALFVVKVSEDIKVHWIKDFEEIVENSAKYVFFSEGLYRKLLIKNIGIIDEGEYTCMIDEDEKCSADLIVIELPPEISTKLKDTTVVKGCRVELSIELTKGDALVKWCKDGNELSFSPHIRLEIDGKKQKLIINRARMVDAGVYSCTVGEQSCNCTLTIEEPGPDAKPEPSLTVTFEDEPSIQYFERTEQERDQTSQTFSTTSTSWMREAGVDPVVRSYVKHKLVGRNEYFFKIWHYPKNKSMTSE